MFLFKSIYLSMTDFEQYGCEYISLEGRKKSLPDGRTGFVYQICTRVQGVPRTCFLLWLRGLSMRNKLRLPCSRNVLWNQRLQYISTLPFQEHRTGVLFMLKCHKTLYQRSTTPEHDQPLLFPQGFWTLDTNMTLNRCQIALKPFHSRTISRRLLHSGWCPLSNSLL